MFDFNRVAFDEEAINIKVNEAIEAAKPPGENFRQYLGASSIGSECQRKVQFDWLCDASFHVRNLDIFDRGHWGEVQSRSRMIAAGFKFASDEKTKFTALDGLFQGHADGVLLGGPQIEGLQYPAIWEHKCLNNKGWNAVAKNGLEGLYAPYRGQVALYQAYLDHTNDALFTVLNADTCARLHLLVPFDAALAQRMSDRALEIITATKAGELLPRFTDNADDWRCGMCGHRERCWKNGQA